LQNFHVHSQLARRPLGENFAENVLQAIQKFMWELQFTNEIGTRKHRLQQNGRHWFPGWTQQDLVVAKGTWNQKNCEGCDKDELRMGGVWTGKKRPFFIPA
jgi:hypothetical protein